MIENKPQEIMLIFHSGKSEDRKARAFAVSVPHFKVKELDLSHDTLTETQILEIANLLDLDLFEILDFTYADATMIEQTDLKGMGRKDILTVLRNTPQLLATPIVLVGKKAYLYHSAFDLVKENFETEDKIDTKI